MPVTIGTHNGVFHCDEVLACYMLKLLSEYKDATIIRSRDQSILDKCDIVVDVGGKYDPATHRYDHHMRDFNESFNTVVNTPNYDSTIKLSSAGLIYCHFGKQIIKHLVPGMNEESLERIFLKVYNNLIQEVDGIDNGVPVSDGKPAYQIQTNLSARIARLNPHWNTTNLDPDTQFYKAMEIAKEEFLESVHYFSKVWGPARTIVKEAIDRRYKVHPSGEIIEFVQTLPWKDHLFDIEKELNLQPSIKYAICKDNSSYRVLAVPVHSGSFICRLFLPEEWRGLRSEKLSKVSDINDCIFVHTVGFIGGHETREGALKMADKALMTGQLKK